MKIVSIESAGKKPVYDLSVEEVEHYVLKNGVVTHNTGIYYSANQIFIISKAQEKDEDGLAGFKFTINIEKSRFVKEKAKLPFTVLYNSGIQKWSSLFDLALESGNIIKPGVGWYNIVDTETGEIMMPKRRQKDIESDDAFFENLIQNKDFMAFIEKKYRLNASDLLAPTIKVAIEEPDEEDDVD